MSTEGSGSLQSKLQDVFECVKLFEVEGGSVPAGGDSPTHELDTPVSGSISIELCSWREAGTVTSLALVCNNGYLVFRITLNGGTPLVKQLKWFENRQKHILGVTFDPHGEWLACACLDGSLCLIPVYSLLTGGSPHKSYGPLNDLTTIQPSKKTASPTSLVWWETMDDQQMVIMGSEVGEITFFDILRFEVAVSVYVSGCIDHLLLAQRPGTSTHLLIGLRGGSWRRMLLEEHFHEVEGMSYTDAHESGYEVVPDDMVIKNYLTKGSGDERFEMRPFLSFSELTEISIHDWPNHHLLSALNLRNHKAEVYSYDFDSQSPPVKAYQLVPGATGILLTDSIIFVISHDDDVDPLAFTLTVMSSGRAGVTVTEVSDEATLHSSAVLQQFTIPSTNNLIGFYSTLSYDIPNESHDYSLTTFGSLDHSMMSRDTTRSHDSLPTSNLGGCVLVTSTCVYQCRQKRSPEALFNELALNPKTQEKAEEFGITYKLDICGLYKIVAKKKLAEGLYSQALKLYEHSRCPPWDVIRSFSDAKRVPELVQYLYQLVYNDTGRASITHPKQVEDLLLLCFAHECLRYHGKPEGAVMMDKFTQFINDKFQYSQSVAMEILVQSGLKEQLFELAKTHRKLSEVLECLVSHGSVHIDPSVLSSLASRQHVETLGLASNGLFLYQMSPSTFVRLLNSKPAILPTHIPHLHTLLPHMNVPTLLRLAKLLDPSQSTIRPLLIKAHSHRKRSNSTGSLLSMVSSASDSAHSEDPGPSLETYLELFLTVLVILNHRRRQKPAGSNPLLSVSPLRSAVSGNIVDHIAAESTEAYTDGSQWLQASTLSAGLHHAAVVTGGNLFTWGSTKNGKLGHGEIEEEGRATPLRVETLSMLSIHVVSVSCGAEHTVALCQEGVFSWGSSSHGQLGHGDELKKTRPVQIASLADKSIISVSCGQYHTLTLDDDHRVWSWGWGVHGQLGLKTVDDKLLPSHVISLDRLQVSFIAAGYGHSAVLTSHGQVLTFGNGMYGQLGHGDKEKQVTPKIVEALSDKSVYLLACGNFHTVAVTTGQGIYSWGKNMYKPQPTATVQGMKEYKRSRERQQSSPVDTVNVQLPQLVTLDPPLEDTIIQMSCGSFHSLLLTSAGGVHSWGSNQHGQLGHTHMAELAQPKKISGFDAQKVITIAAGDEFSLVIDENGQVWTWGRGDRGQLGLQSDPPPLGEPRERSNQIRPIFKPRPLSGIPMTTSRSRKRGVSEGDNATSSDLPVLELDLGWELPDFSAIGSPNSHYGRLSLNSALDALHGFFRMSALLWQCQDWQDWESLAKLYDIEHQWPQAVSCSLNVLVQTKNQENVKRRAPSLVEHYIQKFLLEERDPLSLEFIQDGLIFLQNLLSSWKKLCLENSLLEHILRKHVTSLSYSLSLILRSTEYNVLSLDFHLFVASHLVSSVSKGNPSPETILSSSSTTENDAKPKQLVIETSIGDCRLWVEVLRNLAKDLSKNSSIVLTENTLNGVIKMRQRKLSSTTNSIDNEQQHLIIAFTCGHTFPLSRFQSKIVPEFVDRVQEFPLSTPVTLKYLQLHYKMSGHVPSSCPHCVFQYLRKIQLKECPNVPIKPWNPV
ncbi:uncharacterized protein LOC135344542 isoform X2 [Halichondria panicea]|uniref:uncharacterized protein LOC135344542 isoform X2 n=1 Tax=Halichondria panicea TaxID=6063 RepID=UPI00312B30EC